MKKSTNAIVNSVKIITLSLIFAAGVSYISAWSGPTPGTTPPNNNVPAPVNVGQDTPEQEKLGGLWLNTSNPVQDAYGLVVFGKSLFSGTVQINDGTAQPGYVLTSSDASGTASWQAGGSGSGSLPNNIAVFTTSGSWTAPAGVTRALVEVVGGGGGGAEGVRNSATEGAGNWGVCVGANYPGGGGGAGGYAESLVTVTPGQTYTITVGTGGSAAYGPGGLAANGKNSSFGSSAIGNGGSTGTNASCSGPGAGGAGGSGTGTFVVPGLSGSDSGMSGTSFFTSFGAGGTSDSEVDSQQLGTAGIVKISY